MKNFIDLSYEEKVKVLEWRNSDRVRFCMFNSDEISLKDHLTFIENLKNNMSNKYFLVKDIGVIYFKNILGHSAEIGLYSNPKKFNVGSILMEELLSFDFKTLYLEVVSTNLKAIELYKKYGFLVKNNKKSNNHKILAMELER